MHTAVLAPRLHGHFGCISPEEAAKKGPYVFFLRNCAEGIRPMGSIEEARAEMPRYLILGSCSGNFLQSLQRILKQASDICIDRL
jgi:hypothetical protein